MAALRAIDDGSIEETLQALANDPLIEETLRSMAVDPPIEELLRSLEVDTDRLFAPVLSLLPADVGFDLRTVEIPVGLTAIPSKQMFGFFNQNLVMEYNHKQAVAEQGGHHVIHDDGSLPKLPWGRGEFTMSPSTSPE